MNRSRKRGFILLAVLWVMVGVSVVGLGVALVARRAARSAANRREETQAEWIAEDCAERARAVVAAMLEPPVPSVSDPSDSWRELDRAAAAAPLLAAPPVMPNGSCHAAFRPSGRTIDVNSADAELLSRAFQNLGEPSARVDSLVDAVLDWRDPDDLPRPRGAEEQWYIGQGRAPPRNGPFATVQELARVRGLEHLNGLDSVLGVEPERIVLDRASLAVVAALPGFTAEAAARVAEHRIREIPVGDLLSFSSELSPSARALFLARYPDLTRLTATAPEAWTITVRAQLENSPITSVLEQRIVRAGDRAAIVRRRMWVE